MHCGLVCSFDSFRRVFRICGFFFLFLVFLFHLSIENHYFYSFYETQRKIWSLGFQIETIYRIERYIDYLFLDRFIDPTYTNTYPEYSAVSGVVICKYSYVGF